MHDASRRELMVAGLGVAFATNARAATSTPAPARAGMVQISSVKLSCWDTGGAGPAIVLLHPFTGSGFSWEPQRAVLAGAGYRVIGYSRRGFAGSEEGVRQDPGTGAGDLHELLDVLGVQRAHLIGSSGGSFVAVDYALSHPERVASLTLSCSRLGVPEAEFGPMVKELSPPGFAALPADFRELSPSYRASNPDGTVRWRAIEHDARPGGMPLQPYANHVTLEALSRLRAPVLLIGGDSDLITPPPLLRFLATRIPRATVRIFAECGHSAPWEQPDLFNSTVLAFLKQSRA